jgi:hypothetical protein
MLQRQNAIDFIRKQGYNKNVETQTVATKISFLLC